MYKVRSKLSCASFSRVFFWRCIGTCGETVVHSLDHDVQDVDVEFSRDVTHDVTCLCPLDLDRVVGEALGLDVTCSHILDLLSMFDPVDFNVNLIVAYLL